MAVNKLKVEVAYATPDKQCILTVEVDVGSTIEKTIIQSGILDQFPKIKLTVQSVGIFSKLRKLSDLVQEGDRIEIYRPLIINPKEARRNRSKRASAIKF